MHANNMYENIIYYLIVHINDDMYDMIIRICDNMITQIILECVSYDDTYIHLYFVI